ncbi:DctP family TRAP transporter solute-binding subunit [Desulfopila sp. IMCC35008]|uniref:DctP family TRAP transporter solute-binding subunit n=1 Tax=Desulfopila sp. IMCC35008 TaxID=2653858 RepID=UPI0013D2E104|nr:DctP family TRAP transporter solute-binding subunit [Desulfopila sp. IMCC35008]
MNRHLLVTALLFTFVLTFAASDIFAKNKTYKIVFNEPFSRPHTLAEAANRFKELVEERSKGNIEVDVHYGGVLGTSREALEAVKIGTQTMVDAATAPIVAYEPAMGVLNLPYLFSSRDQWYGILDGPLGSDMLGRLEPHGFVGLAYLENGIRHVTNNVRPIYKPEDLKGIKIRLMQNPVFIATFESFGCLTTATPWSELYSALQQNVVEAQENPVANIYNGKLYEVQNYLSFTGHTYDPNIYFINKRFFDKLPAEYQKLLREVSAEVAAWQRSEAITAEVSLLEELKKDMKINEVSAEEISRFRENVAEVYKDQARTIGEDVVEEWLNAVK